MKLHTRRDFIRHSILGGALSATVPAFLAHTFSQLNTQAAESDRPAASDDSTILVLLQLAGGNDGLNTVVPFDNDFYRKARPRLRIEPDKVLRLNDEAGLHPALAGLMKLHERGLLAVLQGVGYPNPNRSHFRSTEIWQTASEAERFERYGWLGRYFDNACQGCDASVAVTVGKQMPQAFTAKKPRGIVLESPENYRFLTADGVATGEAGDDEDYYRRLNESAGEAMSGGSIAQLGGSVQHEGSALDFLERTALDAQVSSDRIMAASARVKNQAVYPSSQLGNSLKLVARLIGGQLPTRVFYASQGGYDTHTNQAGAHERLLRDLGDSLLAFTQDLEKQGNLPRVLIMTFSEFGRRVSENASGGTDHGAAAPLLLIGGRLKPGLHGTLPSLDPKNLLRGDLRHAVDFRSVYATVLHHWLKADPEKVLGRSFPRLPLLQTA